MPLPATIPEESQHATLSLMVSPAQALAQLKALRELVGSYLVPGEDYGTQPGTKQQTLFKPGADKLCEVYGFYAEPEIINALDDWNRTIDGMPAPLFDYTVKVTLKHKRDSSIVGIGMGNCNSYEAKYLWRDAKPRCPDCGGETLRPSKKEWGGGFYCTDRGCNARFYAYSTDKRKVNVDDLKALASIESQPRGRVPNPDLASQKNTIIKMGKKRAFLDATIAATRSSGIFTQDHGDPEHDYVDAQVDEPDLTPVLQASAEQKWLQLKTEVLAHGYTSEEYEEYKASTQKRLPKGAAAFKDVMAHFIKENG